MNDPPHLVWISVESLRRDHTTMGGYERSTTPNLQRIVDTNGGRWFDNCFCQSIWTPAVSASMLTGTYLSTHRVGADGKANDKLPPDLETLPELFAAEGYRTACFSPNAYLSPATGLDRGFEDFYWLKADRLHELGVVPALKYLLHLRSHGPGFTTDRQRHNLSYFLTEGAKRWMRRGDRPAFLYLHVGNPHHPYLPPRGWREEFTDEIALSTEEAMAVSSRIFADNASMKQVVADGCDLSDEEWEAIRAMYDAEIAYADDRIGHLFDHARSVLDGEVVFVITGDHGELFGERSLLGHNLVTHDAVTNVPLIVHGLDGLNADRSDPVQHVDVTRTVAGVVGEDRTQFQGVDLREGTPEVAVSQRGVAHLDAYTKHDPEFDADAFHPDPVTAIRSESFKYQATTGERELFDLPDETTDVIDEHPDVAERFEDRLDAVPDWEMTDVVTESQAEFTNEMKEQLEDLGYL